MPDEFDDEEQEAEAPAEEEDELSIPVLVRMPYDKFTEALKKLSPEQQTQAKDARFEVSAAPEIRLNVLCWQRESLRLRASIFDTSRNARDSSWRLCARCALAARSRA
eukprot:2697698-Prymnesium_polylepis.2